MGRERRSRTATRQPIPGLRDSYPSPEARAAGKHYPKLGPEPHAASEREPNAVKCAQCAFPIEDHTAVQACPHCGSTNILGKWLGPIQQ